MIHAESKVNTLEQALSEQRVDVDLELNDALVAAYQTLLDRFRVVASSNRIWDVTSQAQINNVTTRSSASTVINRVVTSFDTSSLVLLRCNVGTMHLHNINGGDMYIYPAFIAMTSPQGVGLVDLRDLEVVLENVAFTEEDSVPKDAEVVRTTWLKVNKNGTPDKRFKDNRELPVCRYGQITLRSATGLNESFLISNAMAAFAFSDQLKEYVTKVSSLS